MSARDWSSDVCSSDLEMPPAVLNGTATINATGILTMYQGKMQLVLNDLHDVTKANGEPWYDDNWKLLEN